MRTAAELVTQNGKDLSVRWDGLAEAKLVIKELKLRRRLLANEKRALALQQRMLKAEYTQEVRARGSKMVGGGKLGRGIRLFQTIGRDSRRAKLARDLQPLEQQKARLEVQSGQLESLILQVEAKMLSG